MGRVGGYLWVIYMGGIYQLINIRILLYNIFGDASPKVFKAGGGAKKVLLKGKVWRRSNDSVSYTFQLLRS